MAEVLVGIILFFVSFMGVICNFTVIIFLKRIPSLNQAFGVLTRNQAFADAIHSTTELILVVPMITFNIKFMKDNSNLMSFLLLFGYDTSVLTHLLISLNRFCAVYYPVKYRSFYKKEITVYMVIFTDAFSFLTTGLLYASGCRYMWSDIVHSFLYNADKHCLSISFYGIFCKYIILVAIILTLDLCSILKARSFYKNRSGSGDISNRLMKTKEIHLLIQTCLQGGLFACELILYFYISPLVDDNMIRFFFSTFLYSFIHSSDGSVRCFMWCWQSGTFLMKLYFSTRILFCLCGVFDCQDHMDYALSILCNQEFRAFVFRYSRSPLYVPSNIRISPSNVPINRY